MLSAGRDDELPGEIPTLGDFVVVSISGLGVVLKVSPVESNFWLTLISRSRQESEQPV